MTAMAMHAITNGVDAGRKATLVTKCNALTTHIVTMPEAAVTTNARTVRKRKNAALWAALTAIFHGRSTHVECDEFLLYTGSKPNAHASSQAPTQLPRPRKRLKWAPPETEVLERAATHPTAAGGKSVVRALGIQVPRTHFEQCERRLNTAHRNDESGAK